MNSFALSCIITAALTAILCVVILLNNFRSKVNRAWFLACLSILIWLVGLYGTVVAGNEEAAIFWQRILYLGTILIPALFFYFCVNLLQRKKQNKISLAGIAIALVFLPLIFSKFFIVGVGERTNFGYWPVETGPLYWLFLVYFAFYMAYAIILLKIDSKKYEGLHQKQIQFVYYAALIGFAGGSTNFLLDFNLNIYPVGNYFVIFYVVFISYAILKHHLFSLKIISTELLTFSVWIFLLIRILMDASWQDRIIDGSLLALVVFFGILLIKSVIKEVQQREELEKITIELEAANERLRQLDEAKSEFLSIASHQLRTPMTSIKGLLSMLLEGFWGPMNENQKKYVGQVAQSSERLLALIEDLLNISRIEAGRMQFEFKPISLENLVEDVIRELKPQAETKNLYLKFDKPEKLPMVKADSLKLRQVIQNLIDNSIKYTAKGGSTIQVKQQENNLLFSIKDTGVGLPAGQHLFEKFERGEKAATQHTEGLGLGLYLADKIIKAHHGKIWAESEGEDKGSIFCFTLPIA
jgi:signal transduction histidine kinase